MNGLGSLFQALDLGADVGCDLTWLKLVHMGRLGADVGCEGLHVSDGSGGTALPASVGQSLNNFVSGTPVYRADSVYSNRRRVSDLQRGVQSLPSQ
jgi:hypothetical protein